MLYGIAAAFLYGAITAGLLTYSTSATTIILSTFLGLFLALFAGVFKISDSTAWGIEVLTSLALVISGYPLEALTVAQICAAVSMLRRPAVPHIVVLNLSLQVMYICGEWLVFRTLLPNWNGATDWHWVGAAVATSMFFGLLTLPATGITSILGGYSTFSNSITVFRNDIRTNLLLELPMAMAFGSFIVATAPWGIAILMTPAMVIADALRRQEQVVDVTRESRTDPLTGLHNRRSFDEIWLDLTRSKPREDCGNWLLASDLDHFKKLNDTHGHAAGDEALVLTAQLLQNNVRASDTCVRIGGEEFVVLLRDLPEVDVLAIAERIRLSVESELQHLATTISIGLYRIDPDSSLSDAMERADIALYESKSAGRNRITLAS